MTSRPSSLCLFCLFNFQSSQQSPGQRLKDPTKRRIRTRQKATLLAKLRTVVDIGSTAPTLQVLNAGMDTWSIVPRIVIHDSHFIPSHKTTRRRHASGMFR